MGYEMNLIIIFTLASLFSIGITSVDQQENCKEKLNECEQNLNPVYHQPAELLRSWQNCRISLIEEKLRVTELETALNKKTDSSCVATTPSSVTTATKTPGVEGKWAQIIDRKTQPLPLPGSFQNINEGNSIAFSSYIGRTWIGDNIVPCRIYTDFSSCATAWDLREEPHKQYEVLVGNYVWKWTNSSTPIPNNAVIGGYRAIPGSNKREVLYIGRAIHDGFEQNNHPPNKLLSGHISSDTRELIHVAWNKVQRKSIYQILVQE